MVSRTSRALICNAFAQVEPNHHNHGVSPRSEGRQQIDLHKLQLRIDALHTAERGSFGTLFLADVTGIYRTSPGNREQAVRSGMQFPTHAAAGVVSASKDPLESSL